MISKLRRKFISITAAALFAVILVVVAAINCVFLFQTRNHIDFRLEQLMDGHLFKDQAPDAPAPHEPEEFKSWGPSLMKLRIHPDGCVMLFDKDGTLKKMLQNAPEHYSEGELSDVAAEILRLGKEKGWCQYFRFRTESLSLPDGETLTKVGLINASPDLYSLFSMLAISVIIGALSFLMALLIIVLASSRAIRPMAESYAKQKQFVTDAGHELKTPLTVISADNELARMTFGASEWFDGIDAQISKMNRLVHSLITLARMDEEQMPDFALFSFSDAVYDTAKSFENLILASGRQLSLNIQDEILCRGDESMLRQAAAILMDNAAKYCDGSGTIEVRLKEDKNICLQVINDYAASGDCDLSQVFLRFYRADRARTPDGSYGLGLSIAKSIVEQHKGTIQAKALSNGRILFEITLKRSGRKPNSKST